jgi:hypothetical protein
MQAITQMLEFTRHADIHFSGSPIGHRQAFNLSRSTGAPFAADVRWNLDVGSVEPERAGLANANAIQTIGAVTVVAPRNFIATSFIGGSKRSFAGFHRFWSRCGFVTLRQTFVRRCRGGAGSSPPSQATEKRRPRPKNLKQNRARTPGQFFRGSGSARVVLGTHFRTTTRGRGS